MKLNEGSLKFEFPDENKTCKFDGTPYYQKNFNKMPYAKGVDFITASDHHLIFIEVKNCKGAEHDNNWRIHPNNQKVKTSKTTTDVNDRDSLDIEVAGSFSFRRRFWM